MSRWYRTFCFLLTPRMMSISYFECTNGFVLQNTYNLMYNTFLYIHNWKKNRFGIHQELLEDVPDFLDGDLEPEIEIYDVPDHSFHLKRDWVCLLDWAMIYQCYSVGRSMEYRWSTDRQKVHFYRQSLDCLKSIQNIK